MSCYVNEDWSFAAERQRGRARRTDSPHPVIRENTFFTKPKHVDEKSLTQAEITLMREILRSHLFENLQVSVLRRDKNSPLHSVKSFEQLNMPPNLLKGVYEMGFNSPSRIQETALPTLMADPPANIIAQAQNGTGKTAAFVLSSLYRVQTQLHYPQVLILAPTYELAIQIGQEAQKMAKYMEGIEFRFAVRGEALSRGHRIREHVLIGTPGKVFDWAQRQKHFDLSDLKVFVLDEADIMISIQGHHDQCLRIHRFISSECQMMLFSATYTTEVVEFAEMIIPDPIVIRLKREEETTDNVKQYFIECESVERKYQSLHNIYGVVSIGQAIIFCRTRNTALWLQERMINDGHAVGYLSGELSSEQRLEVVTGFRDGKEKVLITTNVLARGIDIEQVTIVINFDLPVTKSGAADCETYLHRIGRSGRFGKRGIAINMVVDDRDMNIVLAIESHFGKTIHRLDAEDVDALERIDA